MAAAGEVVRGDVDGIPFFAAEEPGPLWAGLVFRVGSSDETAATTGITHLVEHLLMPPSTYPAVDCNATVDHLFTMVWASGEAAEVRRFLEDVVGRIHALPVERVDLERKILAAEEGAMGWSAVRQALALRYGARGVGLAGYGDLAMQRITADETVSWTRDRFTSGNAVLVANDPGFRLELALPPGGPRPAPELQPIPYVEYPSIYRAGMGLLLSLIAEREFAFTTAFRILDHRLRNRLRFELGMAYHIDVESQPLTANESHAWVAADSSFADEAQWVEETLAILDALAADGPTEEELEVERARRRLEDSHPGSLTGWLTWAATEHLLGEPYITREEARRAADELTPPEVAEALRKARSSVLVVGSDDLPELPGFTEYPMTSPLRIEGRRHGTAGLIGRLHRGRPQLIASPEGVTIDFTDELTVTARYDATVLCSRMGKLRTLLTEDGFWLMFDPDAWAGGDRVLKEIDAAIPPELVVSALPELDARIDAVEALASSTFKRRFWVSEELEVLPVLLEDGETLLALASASRGWRLGLLALTDRRLRFVYGDGSEHSLVIERRAVSNAKADGQDLKLLVDGELITFTDVQPKGKATELAKGLEGPVAAPAS